MVLTNLPRNNRVTDNQKPHDKLQLLVSQVRHAREQVCTDWMQHWNMYGTRLSSLSGWIPPSKSDLTYAEHKFKEQFPTWWCSSSLFHTTDKLLKTSVLVSVPLECVSRGSQQFAFATSTDSTNNSLIVMSLLLNLQLLEKSVCKMLGLSRTAHVEWQFRMMIITHPLWLTVIQNKLAWSPRTSLKSNLITL